MYFHFFFFIVSNYYLVTLIKSAFSIVDAGLCALFFYSRYPPCYVTPWTI